jgi:uncharacterized protein (TIGR00266 family)
MAARGQIEEGGKAFLQVDGQEGYTAHSDPSQLLTGRVDNRPSFAHALIELREGQEVVADAGNMMWMDGHVKMSTNCHTGGCCSGCWRRCAGENCCQNKFTGPGTAAFGFDLPGDMLPFAVTNGHGWVVSQGSFICGTPNINVSAKWKGCMNCMCSGEGAFLTHITAPKEAGLFYAGGYGQIQRQEVPAGKCFFVHTGMFFAANDKIKIDITMPGTCFALCCSGEGLVMKFDGPSVVYTQNRDPKVFLKMLNPPPPPPQGGGGGGGGDGALGVVGALAS